MNGITALTENRNHTRDQRDRPCGVKLDPACPAVLQPYDAREAVIIRQAASIARRSRRTVREWCARFDIGRRIAGGQWMVSRVALQMLLDGDKEALRRYLAGDRSSPKVTAYFEQLGVPLPKRRAA